MLETAISITEFIMENQGRMITALVKNPEPVEHPVRCN
jgi:hypothetical protein